jgi:sulfate adenylyltransferase
VISRPTILFVCTANICRSPFAEVLARHHAGDRAEVASAGTRGWTDKPVDADMAAELTLRGIDPDGFRSRKLAGWMVDGADVVLTAEARHRTFVLGERPAAVRRTFTLGQFCAALDEISPALHGVDALLKEVRRARPTARAEDDVPDPYGRGPEAARLAADRIEQHLAAILPRLLG